MNIIIDWVISHSIAKSKPHICSKIPRCRVHACIQLFLDRAQIHGLLDYIKIIRDVILYNINWGKKRSSPVMCHKLLQKVGTLFKRCCVVNRADHRWG
uniref:Uncharacterized protein n=1 Tax=Arundo donax TaxID=35708 RepID=A0A0A8ZQW3_ARUDO